MNEFKLEPLGEEASDQHLEGERMIEDIRVLGTVKVVDINQNPLTVKRKNWLKLSEDVGGMTLIGTFVLTDSLVDLDKEEKRDD